MNEELPEQVERDATLEPVTERVTIKPADTVASTEAKIYHTSEPVEEIARVYANPDQRVKRGPTQIVEAVEDSTEFWPELVSSVPQMALEINEWPEAQEAEPEKLLIEPLIIEPADNEQATEPVELATVGEVLEYVAEQVKIRDEVAAERLEESVMAVELAATVFIQAEELRDVAPEVVGEIVAERIDILLESFEGMPETVEELMGQLEAMGEDEEPELRELLITSVELLQELGVHEPTIAQVVSLARALVMRTAVAPEVAPERVATTEEEWTEDKSIAGERYGLFGIRHLPVLGQAVSGHPLGQLVLRASLAGT